MNQCLRLADDDISAHVPTSIKQKICRGEFVNLAILLKGAAKLLDFCKGSLFKLNSDGLIEMTPKECKDRISSIKHWTDAFIIYSSIYLSNHSDKIYEMLHYMFNIREFARRQGSLAWRNYDEQFRLRQATYPAPWSKINNDLWWRCMQVRSIAQSNPAPLRYTCNEFNKGNCTWPNCKFAHRCTTCSGSHAQVSCFSQTQVSPLNQSTSPNQSFFPGRGRGFQGHNSYNSGLTNGEKGRIAGPFL